MIDLAAARAVCDAATDGDWFADDRGWLTASIPGDSRSGMEREILTLGADGKPEDLRFAEAARTGWPAALSEIETLRAALASALDIGDILIDVADPDSERSDEEVSGYRGRAAEVFAQLRTLLHPTEVSR